MTSVVFAGGGTTGHIGPLLAMARETVREIPEARITVVGTAEGLESRLVPEAGFDLALIDKVTMPRRLDKNLLTFPWRYQTALKQAEQVLEDSKADVLIGVGGYVSASMYAAARKRKIPYLVHEANAKAGIANRRGARHAYFVGTAFENTDISHGVFVGMPMRDEILSLKIDGGTRRRARESLGIDPELKTLVVVGGSLGAASINKAVKEALPYWDKASGQVVHLTGRGKQIRDSSGNVLKRDGYYQYEYFDKMELAYAAADLLIARAGAATVSEVAAVGIPAIFVPLPIGNGEQALNARGLVEAGGAIVVADSDFAAQWLLKNVITLLHDDERLAGMGACAREYGMHDAAKAMVAQIRKIVE